MQKMKKSYEDYVKIKEDVQIAYIKLFGEEKGRELIKQAEKKKAEILKGRNYDSRRSN